MANHEINKLLVVVVLYNLRLEESSSLISLNQNCLLTDVLIYDNSLDNLNQNSKNFFQYLNIKYIHDPSNPGVSKAYNSAVEYAFQNNKSFILLLDQDTFLPKNALEIYLNAAIKNQEIKLFAPCLKFNDKIYSPCNYYMHKGFHKNKFKMGVNSLKDVNFLNSGLLLNIHAFKQTGGYDENIRLYFSDFEFINRFKKYYKSYFLIDLVCLHELASTDKTDLNKALNRFVIYCTDAKMAAKSKLLWFQYCITLGLRSLKLSFHFMNFNFFKIFYSKFI
ncbi:rhamnosyltransferase [Pedobacter sp. CG_S7]|uniref:glycosyltransferase n=1 Tax=Pedobacter sp. CG_S7 TaxID=3143930 RepID=UPI003395C0F4